MIFHSKHFKYTHDLVYLAEIAITVDPEFESLIETFIEIQSYAVEVRYPNETIFLTPEKVEEALYTAKLVRNIITNKLGAYVKYNPIIDK